MGLADCINQPITAQPGHLWALLQILWIGQQTGAVHAPPFNASCVQYGHTISHFSYEFLEGNSFQDGYYIAFNLNLRNYAQDFTTLDNFGTDTTVNEFFRWADIGFTTGLQSRPSEKMIIDWYIGAGIRQKNRSTTDYEQVFDPISGIYEGVYILQEKTSVAPALLGGVKISLLFR